MPCRFKLTSRKDRARKERQRRIAVCGLKVSIGIVVIVYY